VPAKKHGNTPASRQSDNYIDKTAEEGRGSAERPRHKVKAENTHKTPVQAADYKDSQRKFVQSQFLPSKFFKIILRGFQ